MARHLARALGVNVIPCDVASRMPLVKWADLHSPGSRRVTEAEFAEWARLAAERERRGVPTAWQLLPGSGRLVALDVDDPAAVDRLLEIHGETPLMVRSPTPGRAHLWYRSPFGVDLGGIAEAALGGAYAVKARGSAIHAPGSLHRSGRGWYRASLPVSEWTADLGDRLPVLDLAAIDADRVGRLSADWADAAESIAGDVEGERRGRAWLARAEHLTGSRETRTFRAAMSLGDLGLRLELAERLLVEWDAHGGNPRGAADTAETVRRAYACRRAPVGCRRGIDSSPLDADDLLADLRAITPAQREAQRASMAATIEGLRAMGFA